MNDGIRDQALIVENRIEEVVTLLGGKLGWHFIREECIYYFDSDSGEISYFDVSYLEMADKEMLEDMKDEKKRRESEEENPGYIMGFIITIVTCTGTYARRRYGTRSPNQAIKKTLETLRETDNSLLVSIELKKFYSHAIKLEIGLDQKIPMITDAKFFWLVDSTPFDFKMS